MTACNDDPARERLLGPHEWPIWAVSAAGLFSQPQVVAKAWPVLFHDPREGSSL